MNKELTNRIEVLEAQYDNAEDFATAMGVHPATIRSWKAKTKTMTQTAFNLLEKLELEKLKSKHAPGCNCSK